MNHPDELRGWEDPLSEGCTKQPVVIQSSLWLVDKACKQQVATGSQQTCPGVQLGVGVNKP